VVGAWPEPVERVSSFLRESGAEARIQEFPEGTPTAQAAAEAAGCDLEQIVKSLVFMCDERPVVALVPGDRRCDPGKVAAAVKAGSARVAKPPEVEDVLMERSFFSHSVVWAGAGSPSHMVGISPNELGRLSRARPMDVVADQTYDSSKPKES
jgi:prolyl-tRNA editing enzyme YbaK/EbsC (Cys-tRNA(Pro) deacylase)